MRERIHQRGRELRYAFWLSVHPFKGFWEIKSEGAGSLTTAMILLAAFVLSTVAGGLYTGYLFAPNGGASYNVVRGALTALTVFFAFCVANWCLTCLFDGEGTFVDILRATGYALLPMTLTQLVLIVLSHVLSAREAAIYSFLYSLGVLWTAFLVFASVLVTHQYTMFKTVLMLLCILLGMCVLAYIALLFFNLLGQMSGFVEALVKELRNRG